METIHDKFISDQDMHRIVSYCHDTITAPITTRRYLARSKEAFDCLLVMMKATTGCRTDELMRLTGNSFDLSNGMVHIPDAKGSNKRLVPLLPETWYRSAIGELTLMLENRSIGEMLCTSADPQSIKRTFRNRFNKTLAKALGREHSYTTHSMRHTFAARLFREFGNDNRALIKVMQLLGHKSINTTMQYLTSIETKSMDKNVVNAMPKLGY